MKRLKKKQIAELDGHREECQTTYDDLVEAVEHFNNAQENLFSEVIDAFESFVNDSQEEWEKVQKAQDAYNSAVTNAEEFCSDIIADIEAFMDNKSEKWLDSERGELTQSWLNEWEQVELSEVELEPPAYDEPDAPELIELEIDGPGDVLNDLPEEAE